MKRILAVLLILTLIFTFAACGGNAANEASEQEGSEMTGGWTKADSPVITEELAEIFNKAAGDFSVFDILQG